jgi:hypothetical protein
MDCGERAFTRVFDAAGPAMAPKVARPRGPA